MRTRAIGRFVLFSSALAFLAGTAFAQPKPPKGDAKGAEKGAATAGKDDKGKGDTGKGKADPKGADKGKPGDKGKKGKDEPEDLGGDEPEVKAGAPSPQFQKAKKYLDQERWADAAVEFHNVLRNNTDDAGNSQHAKYWLAVALYHLEYYQASYTYFYEIARQPKHLDFEKTLGWMARLATQLPEPADIIGHLGKYTEEQILLAYKAVRLKLDAFYSLFQTHFASQVSPQLLVAQSRHRRQKTAESRIAQLFHLPQQPIRHHLIYPFINTAVKSLPRHQQTNQTNPVRRWCFALQRRHWLAGDKNNFQRPNHPPHISRVNFGRRRGV